VWNALLQILEEGRLNDSVGRVIDFKNTIIILTTNIGAETIIASDDLSSPLLKYRKTDDNVTYSEMKKKLEARMAKEFRPEFLNRLDDIIVFRSLTKDNLKQIVDMELAKVSKRLKEKDLTLIVTDEAKDFLIDKGSSTEFGARPLRRAVEQHLEDAMAEALLRGDFHGKDTITVKVGEVEGDKKLMIESTSTPPAEPAVVASEAK
jgi:ATP-dependent Clp protease ATP-binding subunit ClpC